MKRHEARSIWRCKYCDHEYLAPIKGTLAVSGLKGCQSMRRYPKGCVMRKVA